MVWEWLVTVVVSGVVGAFVSVAFLQPFMAGIIPSRARFWAFRVGKRLRLRKVKIDATVATSVTVEETALVTELQLKKAIDQALPPTFAYDAVTRRYTLDHAESGIRFEVSMEPKENPEQLSIRGVLGATVPRDLAKKLLAFHVWFREFVDRVNSHLPGKPMRPVPKFAVEGTTSWEPDLVRFLREASKTPIGRESTLRLSVTPEGDVPIVFSDSSLSATGDLGSKFVERLESVLTVYA